MHGKDFRVNKNGNIFIPGCLFFSFLTLTQLALCESSDVEEASRPSEFLKSCLNQGSDMFCQHYVLRFMIENRN